MMMMMMMMMTMCQDVCPTGHLFLGLASLAPLLLPGLMYSLATFLHYQVLDAAIYLRLTNIYKFVYKYIISIIK